MDAIKLGALLVRHGIIDAAAIEDAENYDGGHIRHAVYQLFAELNSGETICVKCGLRTNGEGPEGDF